MHLLAAQPGDEASGEAVDLGQTPGEVVVLAAADSELALLAAAHATMPAGAPSLRLANLMQLGHPLSVDLWIDRVARHAKVVVVRLLGGRGYWSYGVDQLVALARAQGIVLALLPGDDRADPDLMDQGTVAPEVRDRLWRYLIHGGIDNARSFLLGIGALIGRDVAAPEPVPLPRAGLYGEVAGGDSPVAAVVFYRALVQAGNLAPVDALIEALRARGLAPLPIHAASLKDPIAAAFVTETLAGRPPSIILNATGFALATGGASPFAGTDCPILQVVFAGGSERQWTEGTRGLSPQDLAMNVALPEVDGRVLARAVSFKTPSRLDATTECAVVAYRPVPDRIAFVADQAAAWAKLRATPAAERRIAVVLANYPNRDGRVANGVGLDTPESVACALAAMARAGYRAEGIPATGAALMDDILAGPTNARDPRRPVREALALPDYEAFFVRLPAPVRRAVTERWGPPERDPFFRPGDTSCGAFALPVLRYGNVAVGIQPARGYNIDPQATYHDPALPPPHGYLAFYAWLRDSFGAHAAVHFGKHGNLEWLPGKAVALSSACFPEAALGPIPHLYPFIVNDPGEGTQAKRRASAVIVDHLTPPLTRAESYGPLRALERLIDEYAEAAVLDPRRASALAADILDATRAIGLDRDVGIVAGEADATALGKLDTYLCELKELQIRDGLHVFGRSPEGGLAVDLACALARLPRGSGEGGEASLVRALAADLGLGFDPLAAELGTAWTGPRPGALAGDGSWRTAGDTVERLEALARRLVAGEAEPEPSWTRTLAVLDRVRTVLAPAVAASGPAEIAGLLAGLDGRFVAPGPSGAPTRGRPEVLPTGRNFYSVDLRALPTPAAWRLGWASASLLVERHLQDSGRWPRRMALSAWGTATMRTGGDDIAQALALMGTRPTWEATTGRVTGFEILPPSVLGRPRVDVTLRVSGFFRDAFANLIDLFDAAARAVATLDEAEAENPLAARVRVDRAALEAAGVPPAEAASRAGARVFGSAPGAYGAGLQALIDERLWRDDSDLARAYLAWGGYAYGGGSEGRAAEPDLAARLAAVEAVVHNQDNREHDLLDSDDYYQFEGGLAAAVRTLSGTQPALYHNDHSRPETPRIRTLRDEIGRIVRARVVNPKWIGGVMRHGYKGAAEMAATVDYLFAFAATAKVVEDHHFDAVYDAYLVDPDVAAFLARANPAALAEMASRLAEAIARGLWRPRSNSAADRLAALAAGRAEAAA
jgi:cobaltochelatase CobN